MLKRYFLDVVRNLRDHPVFTLLNITGFSAGLICSLLVLFGGRAGTNLENINKRSSPIHHVFEKQVFDNRTDAFTLLRVCLEMK